MENSDINWVILDKEGNKIHYELQDNAKSKSIGSIQTPLELNRLIYKTLEIVSPNLAFHSSLPNYIIGVEEPPKIEPTTRQPHHRNDLLDNPEGRYIAYDNTNFPFIPTITWDVVRSEPGGLGSKAFDGDREVKPREREAIAIFSNNDKVNVGALGLEVVEKYGKLIKYINVYGQHFDNLIQYNIWATTSWEAEELTEWFQEFMLKYTGMFRQAGIVNMYFDRRVRDDKIAFFKNKYHVKSVLYYFRTEKISVKSVLPIKRIDMNVMIDSLSDLISNPNTYISNNYDKIVDHWVKINNDIYI